MLGKGDADYPLSVEEERREKRGKLTGDGLVLFGGKSESKAGNTTGIGVNSVLWRAALDTISFMPLASADPFGGVILTDWYENADAPGERFKMNILILNSELKASALSVSVFKQAKEGDVWVDKAVTSGVAQELEDKILTRAREMRINQVAQ